MTDLEITALASGSGDHADHFGEASDPDARGHSEKEPPVGTPNTGEPTND